MRAPRGVAQAVLTAPIQIMCRADATNRPRPRHVEQLHRSSRPGDAVIRKLLLILPILAGAAALSGPVQAAPAAQLARLDALAVILATPDATTETVQYYRGSRREEARRHAEMRRRAEWHHRHGHSRY